MAKLTDKQRLFVAHYLTCFNAAKAARLAGYSEKTARSIGAENLTKPDIRAAIDEAMQSVAMSAGEVLARLSAQARGDLGDFLNWNADDLGTHPQSFLLKRAKVTRRTTDDGDEETIDIELYDAQAALVKLGQTHKLFVERQQVDDWQTRAVELIRRGEIEYEALANEFDEQTATRLFAQAGKPAPTE